jgi:hypothetical protein
LKIAASRPTRGSTTLATPTWVSARPEAKRSVLAWAPVRMLNRLVFPTLEKPSSPNFMARILSATPPRLLRLRGRRAESPPRETSGLAQHAAQHELDLPVQAAQIVARPAFQRLEHVGIDPEEKRPPLAHDAYW